jgi:hypothetical protein
MVERCVWCLFRSLDHDAVQNSTVVQYRRTQSHVIHSRSHREHVICVCSVSNGLFVILAGSLKRPPAHPIRLPHPSVRYVSTFRILHIVLCPALRFGAKILLETGGLLCQVEDDASRLTDFISYRNHNGSPSCSLLPLLQE